MIVTLTANPSLDRTLEIPELSRGEVVRATGARVDPGGKGVNVARALVKNGVPARAVLPAGGPEGDEVLDLLEAAGMEVLAVPIGERIRANVTLAEPDGTVTKVNAAGPRLSAAEAEALVDATVRAARAIEWAALCGALSPGTPEDLYRRLVEELRGAGVRVAVDSSGAAFAMALEAGPDLIKPNTQELAEVLGRPVETLGAVLAGARDLIDGGVGHVLVSLGERGAVSVGPEDAAWAWTPPVIPRSNVGAGDAALAGFLAAGGAGREALRAAVAWGAGAVRLPGTQMPGPADVDLDEVEVEDLEAGPVLEEGVIG